MSKIKKRQCITGLPQKPLEYLCSHIKWLDNCSTEDKVGKLLTLIDGTIVDEKQNKAIKDIIKEIMWGKIDGDFELKSLLRHFSEEYCIESAKMLVLDNPEHLEHPTERKWNFN